MIFLDVGSHNGQTLAEVTNDHYTFSRIHAFEPMPNEYSAIKLTYGRMPNVTLHNAGLADFTGQAPIYGSNSICEASMFASKVDVDETISTDCRFMRATDFIDSLPDEPIIAKMNCEGAEVAILNDLFDSGRINRLTHLTVDFDIRRCPGHEDKAEWVIAQLNQSPLEWRISGEHFHGDTHQEKIQNWLAEIL